MVVGFDGVSLSILHGVFTSKKVRRISFDDTSIAPVVFKECVRVGARVAIVGSAPGVARRASDYLAAKYRGLEVVEVYDGYFSGSSREAVILALVDCDVVVCGMGAPLQEGLLLDLRAAGWDGVGFTCGGYLDQLVDSGGGEYYPILIDKLQLRWAYRIWREPRRLLGRYAFHYPVGILYLIRDSLSKRLG